MSTLSQIWCLACEDVFSDVMQTSIRGLIACFVCLFLLLRYYDSLGFRNEIHLNPQPYYGDFLSMCRINGTPPSSFDSSLNGLP